MDYLGLPYLKTNLLPLYNILDLASHKAVVPGKGDTPVVWTHTRDVGKYVNELLKLPADQWPRESSIVGEKISPNDLLALAERLTGMYLRRPFDNPWTLTNYTGKENLGKSSTNRSSN